MLASRWLYLICFTGSKHGERSGEDSSLFAVGGRLRDVPVCGAGGHSTSRDGSVEVDVRHSTLRTQTVLEQRKRNAALEIR
jgi:hypothetical protein